MSGLTSSAPAGVLLVDKPEDITSHGVVARARRALGTRKVGHAGTLDPMATGLLILGVGTATRLLTYLVGLDKEYLATIRLGRATTTDDREGEPLGDQRDARAVPPGALAEAMARLTGPIEQVPSSVSAIKVDGRRSYARVRDGETVELASRPVTVSQFASLGGPRVPADGPEGSVDVDVRVRCSSGTYVRALARDLGEILGVGGHLTALRRTEVGPFPVGGAADLDSLSPDGLVAAADIAARLFPELALGPAAAADVRNGKRIRVERDDAPVAAAVGPGRELIAMVSITGGLVRVLTGFPPEPSDAPPHAATTSRTESAEPAAAAGEGNP
ncbi:MAG TPA: tRNA pseudouridine(55) synthase TruB [Naasia sp.]|jgi:tRNA pseudouridine55 synthase